MNFIRDISGIRNAIALFAASLLLSTSPVMFGAGAIAEEPVICVVCTGPDQTYRCNVMRDEGTTGSSGFQYLCISEIAREMGHQSCGVRRQSSGDCDGIEKVVIFKKKSPVNSFSQSAPGSAQYPPVDGAGEAGVAAGNDDNQEPKTLLELTDQTVKKSQKQLKKTGQTISDATKATGRTITDAAKKTGNTVGDAVKKTGETVGGAVEKSGEAIGGAAKSTYHCIKSLFTDCF